MYSERQASFGEVRGATEYERSSSSSIPLMTGGYNRKSEDEKKQNNPDHHLTQLLKLKQENHNQKMQVLRHASSIATKPLGGGLLFGDFNGTDVVSDGVSSTQRIGTAQREVDQFREDIKKLKYGLPQKTESQLNVMGREQLLEYVKYLHKDNEYVGSLAVESKARAQRLAAEVERLKQKIEELEQTKETQQLLFYSKWKHTSS